MNPLNIYHPCNSLPHFLRGFDAAPDAFRAAAGFRVDVGEDEKQYRLRADLPGADKNNVSVNVEDNVLTVAAKLEPQTENAVRQERLRGEFSRSFRLPRTVDSQNIKADMKNGVLTVVLPKAESAGRKIEIGTS